MIRWLLEELRWKRIESRNLALLLGVLWVLHVVSKRAVIDSICPSHLISRNLALILGFLWVFYVTSQRAVIDFIWLSRLIPRNLALILGFLWVLHVVSKRAVIDSILAIPFNTKEFGTYIGGSMGTSCGP